jgi:transposase
VNTEEKMVRTKVGLLRLAQALGSVSKACKVMGYSRDSFYRFKGMYEEGGELGLIETSRKKPCIKNRVGKEIENAILEIAVAEPGFGQVRVAKELQRQGMSISSAGVRCVWLRHNLETIQKRRALAKGSSTTAKSGMQLDTLGL